MKVIEHKIVKTYDGLTKENIEKIENRRLGILVFEDGACKIVSASGVGVLSKEFKNILELNEYVSIKL